MKSKHAIAIAITATAIALGAIAQGAMDSAPAPQETALKPVKLMTVDAEERVLQRTFFGKVVARRTVDLAFQVGGQIREFPITEGSTIAQGELIARLDLRPFELALEQAKLQKTQADRDVARLRKLKGTSVSQVSIDDAETAAALAEIKVENAEIALDDATLHAPFDALIASRSVENFTTISAGTPVVRLHDMSEIRVEVDVPEVLVQKANLADNVTVLARFPNSNVDYAMSVREIKAETSTIGQTYRATFGMAPPKGLAVLPGSSVTVTATLSRDGSRILLPASAIAIDPDGATYVFRFEPRGADTGRLSRVPMSIEPTEDGRVEVTAGLLVGEEIALAGVDALEQGQQVRRFTGFGK
ncbi:efflux RND transporter periplasmic adaptor subunit [Tropicimonas sp. IMCC6043]|uniref:efflux RND transporter periplasmic adaptor subunit n=1 Tax=Tropicimonas sp. IMCC6043 TaxID=2510645 RepID=UPI00101CDB58|nr:efflux RND transporter periplasmic adaptor subunit [Tropicimonas sp. IMCC6043]RYH09324.1 efflux RND transporter periplasmic adaptor subunit [Tropicimonas sp. IMCC6043]